MARRAVTALVVVLAVGGLLAAAPHVGPILWDLTAPADRLGVLVAEAERDLAQRHAANAAAAGGGARAQAGTRAPASTAASGPAVDGARREPFVRVGARVSVAERPTAETATAETVGVVDSEPALAAETPRAQTMPRMSGELLVDAGQPRDELVEAGFEYRFLERGLEKVTLWEVRR